jgi:hypothetical protein
VHLHSYSAARAELRSHTLCEASDDLWKEIKYHPTGRELLKAINLWTKDPSQPPRITPSRLTAYTINATLRYQTEIGWSTLFRGFLSHTLRGDSLHSPVHRLLRACSPSTALQSPVKRYRHSKSTPSLYGTRATISSWPTTTIETEAIAYGGPDQ